MGNIVLYNLLDYGNEFIEKLSSKEMIARNSLSVINTSIDKKITLRQDFDISEDGKILTYLKSTRINDSTSIINITELIDNREIEIDDLSKKREVFSNNVNKIRKYKCNLKTILTDGRSDQNGADHGLKDKVNSLLHNFDIKREVFFGAKGNGVNCRILMKHHIDIINCINNFFHRNE